MTKSNPLFVDSTKFHGDLIGTQIELRGVMIYDDEALFAVITNHQGHTKRLPMRAGDEGYEARIHLSHQTLITYRFIIEKDGREFLYSKPHKARAQYAIIEEWQPTEEDPEALHAEGAGESSESMNTVEPVEAPVAVSEIAAIRSSPFSNPNSPFAGTPVPSSEKAAAPKRTTPAHLNSDWPKESAIGIRSLIDKWGF